MKKNEIKFIFSIENGVIKYHDHDFKVKLDEFKKRNNIKKGEVVFTILDGPEYFQHKYFHGYVLPSIADAQGEKDLSYLKEYVLKQEFLFVAVNDLREIPARHRARARIIQRETVDVNGEITVRIIGYVPSTTTLTFDEMKAFIVKCEEIRDGLIDWEMPEEARQYRNAAFGIDINQAGLFL